VEHRDKWGRTALIQAVSAQHYISTEIVSAVIAHGASLEETAGEEGNTPLLMSAAIGHEVVDILIRNGANIEHTNRAGYTALCRAALNGKTDTVRSLLRAKANPKHVTYRMKYTPLCLAANKGHIDVCRLLLGVIDTTNLEHTDSNGNTALALAVGARRTDVVRLLLRRGAILTDDLIQLAKDRRYHRIILLFTQYLQSMTPPAAPIVSKIDIQRGTIPVIEK
jgi:ankyrin repeat protein